MDKRKRPIGVFDSGIGGLTVLTEMAKQFPNENFIYVADQGHCPYGTKTSDEIAECVQNVTRWLSSQDVKMIVIACNTATLFIDKAREVTSVPVIGVIDATCNYAFNTSKNKRILVIATIATIEKGKYQEQINKLGGTSIGVKASEFVDFVEHNELDDPKGLELVKSKLESYKDDNFDTLIHGCTHFSLLEDDMRKVIGNRNYVACGYPTSLEVAKVLKSNDLENNETNRYIKIFTTGNVDDALNSMKWFKTNHEEIKHIDIK